MMNWKAWKRGLLVAGLTGLLTGLVTIGVLPHITWRELFLLLTVGAAKDALLFLSKHPVETVRHTEHIRKL